MANSEDTLESANVDKPITGDCWDEDSGEFLGSLSLEVKGDPVLPAQLSVWFKGYYYIFKPQSKYKDESESEPTKEYTKEELHTLQQLVNNSEGPKS